MHPELFHIGPVPIKAYGLMLALSFFAGLFYLDRVTRRDRKSFEPYLTLAYIMIFGGLLGARLSYVAFHLDEFAGHWARTFNPFSSSQFGIAGLNLYGGVLLAIAGSFIYCHRKKLPVLGVFDYFAPTLGIGLALTRIGCFLNGCCFGLPCNLPWGVSYPPGSIPFYYFGEARLHPTQLYSSLYGLLLFIGLHFLLKKKKFAGQVVAVLFMTEAVFRFAIEYVRYYEDAMFVSFLGLHPTFNQIVSVALFLLGLGIYLTQRKAGRKAQASI